MSYFGATPSQITRKMSSSFGPCSQRSSVRLGGFEPSGACGPFPFASAPWQDRQYCAKVFLPSAIVFGVTAGCEGIRDCVRTLIGATSVQIASDTPSHVRDHMVDSPQKNFREMLKPRYQ